MQKARDFHVYHIFSNTGIEMHRTGCNFTSQIVNILDPLAKQKYTGKILVMCFLS